VRRILTYLAIGFAAYYGWRQVAPDARETVLLHTASFENQDHFATLWVVDDGPVLWIRSETRKNRWLDAVRQHPRVEVRRAGVSHRYDAMPFDTPEAIARVDALFREKYGMADRFRALIAERDPLPIRLERND
jgi:hypothetical protein